MIRISVFNTHPRYRIPSNPVCLLARRVLRAEGEANATIGVVFTDNPTMTSLNRKYLNHRTTTDVISFPLTDEGSGTLEGEVYVNLDQARRQASYYGVTIKAEVGRLVVHGVLHLVGYEDNTAKQKVRMRELENSYLAGNREK